jgi:hypothetical protein
MTQFNITSFTGKAKVYVKENWGSPFIIGFMLLLIVAAAALSAGLSSLADNIAVYSYYALIVGVVLQLVSFLRSRKKDSEAIR